MLKFGRDLAIEFIDLQYEDSEEYRDFLNTLKLNKTPLFIKTTELGETWDIGGLTQIKQYIKQNKLKSAYDTNNKLTIKVDENFYEVVKMEEYKRLTEEEVLPNGISYFGPMGSFCLSHNKLIY